MGLIRGVTMDFMKVKEAAAAILGEEKHVAYHPLAVGTIVNFYFYSIFLVFYF